VLLFFVVKGYPQNRILIDQAERDSLDTLEQELLELDSESFTGDAEGNGVRPKRTIRVISRVMCIFFRSLCPAETPPSEQDDDFWLNYLNNNGTELTTTTTRRPGLFARKREFLRQLFPNIFGRRAGNGEGGLLSRLLQIPMRIFQRLTYGRRGGGGYGYGNDDSY